MHVEFEGYLNGIALAEKELEKAGITAQLDPEIYHKWEYATGLLKIQRNRIKTGLLKTPTIEEAQKVKLIYETWLKFNKESI